MYSFVMVKIVTDLISVLFKPAAIIAAIMDFVVS